MKIHLALNTNLPLYQTSIATAIRSTPINAGIACPIAT